jgi:hypothetical protein
MAKAVADLFCPITGETHCKCITKRTPITSFHVNLKETLRKLFTDHAVYTKFTIDNIVDGSSATDAFLARLLVNQKDIGDQLAPIVGVQNGRRVTNVLTEHIKLAGKVITIAKNGGDLDAAIANLFKNSDEVAAVLSSLNPQALPLEAVKKMFKAHNQFVIDMTVARIKGMHREEVMIYDAYYNEILDMSDAIYAAL